MGLSGGRTPKVSNDENKDFKILFATLKFDIIQSIEEQFKEIRADIDRHWRSEAARKREATWS